MYGDIAQKLVLEAKRSKNLSGIPNYNEDFIQSIIRENNLIDRKISEIDAEDDDIQARIQAFVGHLTMRRNKRALYAYEKQRIDKLDKTVWDNLEIEDKLEENLSHVEKEYLDKYNELVIDYKNEFPDIDLSGSLEPPSEVFIDVRVLKDAGEIQTEYGVFNLTKNSQFFVRHSDVERLIQQGYLRKL